MAESVYKVIELVGTSTESWEKAAAAAVERAGESLRDLRDQGLRGYTEKKWFRYRQPVRARALAEK